VPQSFAERLRVLRTRRRMTPSSLAHAVGVTEGAIRQMESGQTKRASFVTGLRLADVLGVTAWYLALGEDGPPETGSRSAPDPSLLTMIEDVRAHVTVLDRRVKAVEARLRSGKRRKASD
jgi:transcriptional regulator with XRE-family HTH domain